MSSGNDKFEREFEAFLAEEESRVAAAYRRLPKPEPDARLDAAVRSMAHRALNPQLVATPRATVERRRRVRWIPALGAAAGVVLAAGIAFKLNSSHEQRAEFGAPANEVISVRPLDAPPPAAPPLSPPPPTHATESAVTAPAGGASAAPGMQTVPAAAAKSLAKPVEPQRSVEQPAAEPALSTGDEVGKVEKAAKLGAAPQAFPTPAPARRHTNTQADAVERRETMAEGAWQNLHDREAEEKKAADRGRVDDARDKAASTSSGFADRKEPSTEAAASRAATVDAVPGQQRAQEPSKLKPAPVPPREMATPAPSGTMTAPPPPAAEAPTRDAGDAAGANPVAAERNVPESSAAPQDALKQNRSPASTDPNARLYPEHWLANIRTMLREHRREEALRSLGEFRRLYPGYQLPDDLRDLR